jgi:outer membrane receptor for ferrienterochelin and colicin
VPDPLVSRQLAHAKDNHWLVQPSLYLEGVWKPFDGTKIVPGLRLDYEGKLKYVTLDPRLSVFQTIVEGTVLKGGIGIYQQPPDFRFQQWTREFGNPYLGPERSVQAMLGVEQRITDAINLDVQLYYKWMDNLMWPSTRQVERDGELVIERYNNSGVGRTYGAEILLRHELTSRFFGWIAYSFGRSERRSDVEGWRNGQFDQPHHLIVVASYKWPWDIVTGVRFQYSSGNLATPVDSTVYDADADLHMPMMGKPFSVRGPEFISLDLRLDKRFVFQQWMVNVFLDVQNVTNNKNGEFIYYSYDYTKTQYVRGMPVFPQIGIKAEF